MRRRFVTALLSVLAVASCERQFLEIVPSEAEQTSPDASDGGARGADDEDASDGGRAAASGGNTGNGPTGGAPPGRGGTGAGGGPSSSGGAPPAGGAGFGGFGAFTCDTGDDCTGAGFRRRCDPTRRVCVECTEDAQCRDGASSQGLCEKAFGRCVECLRREDCFPQRPVCDPARFRCEACVEDEDCSPEQRCSESHECMRRP